MKLTGGCYCRKLRYEAEGEPRFKGQCHCRECQYITGGQSNVFMIWPIAGFRYSEGSPKSFTRSDIATPGTREFCGECGTHILARSPVDPNIVALKVGTLDDPSVYGMPQAVSQLADKQSFHVLPEGIRTFEKFPKR